MTKINYLKDCLRIQKILLKNGIEATLAECQMAYMGASASWDAQWLHIDDKTDEYIFDFLEDYWDLSSKITYE